MLLKLFEKCGRICFSSIHPSLFFVLLCLPILTACFFVYLQNEETNELEALYFRAKKKEKMALIKKGKKERFLARYSQSNPYFIDEQIESLSLLQKEKERLHSLLNHPAFPESTSFKERLKCIDKNKLLFTEGEIRTSKTVKEVEEKQRYCVEMDETDLKRVLSVLEDIPIDPFYPPEHTPQILIQDFQLKVQNIPLQPQNFEVEISLLKREFTTL